MSTARRPLHAVIASAVTLAAPAPAMAIGQPEQSAACLASGAEPAGMVRSPMFAPRVMKLLDEMTLDEKISLTVEARDPVNGAQAGYTPGVPRLGVPPLRWVDGPGGVDNRYDATSLPQPMALAATFNRELFSDYGSVEGAETRATGMDVFLGPMADIARLPNGSRNATGHGEDPFLDAEIVRKRVEAIQAQGALAVTKHFLGYNQQTAVDSEGHQKLGADFQIDPRTLEEIYLPGFEAGVEAGTAGIMAAYNVLNGCPNAENMPMLQGVLRGQFGFKGFVVSDWGANHSTQAITRGLDVEFSGSGLGLSRPNYFGPALKAAIERHEVSPEALDQAVGRVLSTMDAEHMLDRGRRPAPATIDVAGHASTALKVAEQSIVLLKNDGALPLSKGQHVVLVGPTAGQLVANPGFGSSEGLQARKVSPLLALRRELNEAGAVEFAVGQDLTGSPIPAESLHPEGGSAAGLTRLSQDGSVAVIDPTVDFTGTRAFAPGRSYVWKGTLVAPSSGDYDLMLQGWGGSGELEIDGKPGTKFGVSMFNFTPKKNSSLLPTTDNLDNGRMRVHLEKGKAYPLLLTVRGWGDQPVQARLAWVTPEMRRQNLEAAAAAARKASVAVVMVWQRAGEQADPEESLHLPDDQDAMIEAVAAANPNTVVVLTSGAVQMPWLSRVKAVMEMWFAGQEGGTALAKLLTGEVSPSGRLPITFPLRMADSPAYEPGHPERFRGVDGKVRYSEGVFVGYRWFDERAIAPLFPFGHGLSYSSFRYEGLSVSREKDGARVSFTITNDGTRRAREVPQVYVGRPRTPPVPMPPRQLAGFASVELEPGASRTITVHLGRRRFTYWNEAAKAWSLPSEARPIEVGGSSRDIRLTGRFTPS